MARKKQGDSVDAARDFFGDSDVDWLDDEDEHLPAPPPPPVVKTASPVEADPLSRGPSTTPRPSSERRARRTGEVPRDAKGLESAPTLIFSSVPTLPPIDSPVARRGAAAEPPSGGDPPTEPTETLPAPDEGRSSDPDAVFEDHRSAAGVEFDPVDELPGEIGPVRIVVPHAITPGPSIRRTRPPAADRSSPQRRGAPSEPPARVVQAPGEGLEAWREAVHTLEAEALETVGAGRALLLAEAGRIAMRVLGDAGAAEALLSRADIAGPLPADAWRLLAEARGVLGRFEAQEQALVHLAEASEGADAGEAWLEAALVAWRRLDRPADAVEYLRRTAAVLPDDYTSRALLRALLPTVAPEDVPARLDVLESLARLAEGGVAADAWVELASLASQHPDHLARVRPALEAALEAEPGHTRAFQHLEQELEDDPVALAALYRREAARDGSDAGWWMVKAARTLRAAGGDAEAAEVYALAADAGHGSALRELEAAHLRVGADAELEAALAREAETTAGEEGRAFALYRLGWLRETGLGDAAGALAAYREALAADALAWPAAEAVGRLVAPGERRAFWEERLATATTAVERRAVRLLLAELAEADDDPQAARALLQAVLDEDGGDAAAEVARDGLDRVLQRLSRDSTPPSGLRPSSTVPPGGLRPSSTATPPGGLRPSSTVPPGGLRPSSTVPPGGLRPSSSAARTALSELRKHRAESASDTGEKVGWLLLAATDPAADDDDASSLLGLALDARPDHPVALAAITLPLERKGAWRELARRLRAAGEAALDPARRAAYLYRAARVLFERVGDEVAAGACADQAVEAEPRLAPARWLARRIRTTQPDGAAVAAACREQADLTADAGDAGTSAQGLRAWGLFAAAVAEGAGPAARAHLEVLLDEQPEHPGALALVEVLLLADADRAGLVRLQRRAVERAHRDHVPSGREALLAARLAARTAELLAEAGETVEAALVLGRLQGVPGAPLRAAARLALWVGAPDRAIELLSSTTSDEDRIERARLLAEVGRPEEALPELMQLVDRLEDKVGVAARAATVAQAVGDAEAMVRAYAAIAEHARSPSLRVAYSAWTAMQLQAGGRDDLALHQWQLTLAERPSSTAALAGAASGLVARRDADGLVKLFAIFRPESPPMLAEALVRVADYAGAAEVLGGAAELLAESDAPPEPRLATLLWIERLRGESGQWQAAFDALARRRELCRSARVRESADAMRRWILSEKLADSDAAWELYQRLHDEAPEDRQVTEALARIAGARGEVSVAIGYLQELAQGAAGAAEAARYRRRIGEVHERSHQPDAARQAYLDALDHVPDDREALDGLRRIAEQAKDWPGLVAVLQRESASPDPARRIAVRREIARVDEERLGDRRVAMDAWRAVLDVEPTDREALEHLTNLARALGEWGVFVETGETLARSLSGSEKAALLREVGIACADRLGRDDAVRYFEEAVAVTPPDVEAAHRLEVLARSVGDWPATVRALSLQADAAAEPERRIEALLDAARLEAEALHDKEAASGLYARVLELRPDHELALRFMVAHLFDSRRFEEALPLCRRLEPVVERDQDLDDFDARMELAGFYFSFAELLRHAGEDEEALARFERTLELNPTHLPSLEAVGPLYTGLERWDAAERVYRQLLQLSGGQGDRQKVASTYTALGLVERRRGLHDKAYKRFSRALELHPNHTGALKGMALVLEDRQDWSNLLNVYNNIIYHATVPEDVIDAYMTKGRILDDRMQRQDKAAQHYERSLDFDPNQPGAYLRLAELAMRRDAYADADACVAKALALDEELVAPFRARLELVRAAARQHAGRTAEAERTLREVQALDAELAAALGDAPLRDLERVRQVLKERLPA